jgi:AbrB family looped-hinge helix DNA binding protein
MTTATLTSKGQITLPKAVRERLGLERGDRVSFHFEADGRITVAAEAEDLADLAGTVLTSVKGVSLEDLDEAVRLHGGRDDRG